MWFSTSLFAICLAACANTARAVDLPGDVKSIPVRITKLRDNRTFAYKYVAPNPYASTG
jgi:hypothetical protein